MNEICNFKVRAQQNNTICFSHLVHEYQWTSISCSPSTIVAWKNESVTENHCKTSHFNASIKSRNDWTSHYDVNKYLWLLPNIKIHDLISKDWNFMVQFNKKMLHWPICSGSGTSGKMVHFLCQLSTFL